VERANWASVLSGGARARSRLLIVGAALPILWSIFVYSGFTSNYTGGVFTVEDVIERYQGATGISRYRVLGPYLLLQIVGALQHLERALPIHAWNRNILVAVTPFDYHVYEGYVLLNGAAFVVWSVVLGLHLRLVLGPRQALADLLLLTTQTVIALTAFTVTPYDHLSYLFITLLFCGFVAEYPSWLLVGVTVLGALTRESVVLAILAAGATVGVPALVGPSSQRLRFWLICAAFAATYLALRLALGFESALVETQMVGVNFQRIDVLSILGVTFGLIAAMLPALFTSFSRRQCVFLLATLPYWAVILWSGIWFEARLYVPVFLGSVLIAATELGSAQSVTCVPRVE
jgi:hypothetical protein